MSLLLLSAVLFLLQFTEAKSTSNGNTTNGICPSTRCNQKDPNIRFPFRLKTQPTNCGLEDFEISCSNSNNLIRLPSSTNNEYYVQQISYSDSSFTIIDVNDTICPLQSLLSLNLNSSKFYLPTDISVLKCSEKLDTTPAVQKPGRPYAFFQREVVGPIDCLKDDENLVYIVSADASMDMMPSSCRRSRSGEIMGQSDQLSNTIKDLMRTRRIVLQWQTIDGCSDCERSGNICSFNSTSNSTVCFYHKGNEEKHDF